MRIQGMFVEAQMEVKAADFSGGDLAFTGLFWFNSTSKVVKVTDGANVLTLVDLTTAQALTNKDIDGATAADTSRITIPKAAKATLNGLTRKEATIVYATDESKFYGDNGSALVAVGAAGGGTALEWLDDASNTPVEIYEYGTLVRKFVKGDSQALTANYVVPATYIAGTEIKIKVLFYSDVATNDLRLSNTTTLIRTGTDALDDTTNQEVTNTADQTIATEKIPYSKDLSLTDASGEVNSVAVAAGDILKISVTRGTPAGTENTGELAFMSNQIDITGV